MEWALIAKWILWILGAIGGAMSVMSLFTQPEPEDAESVADVPLGDVVIGDESVYPTGGAPGGALTDTETGDPLVEEPDVTYPSTTVTDPSYVSGGSSSSSFLSKMLPIGLLGLGAFFLLRARDEDDQEESGEYLEMEEL